jgi:hypothetical protein
LQVFVRDNNVDQALRAAEKVGKAIKKDHPILQVAVYDGIEGINKIIELP